MKIQWDHQRTALHLFTPIRPPSHHTNPLVPVVGAMIGAADRIVFYMRGVLLLVTRANARNGIADRYLFRA
jgi:hypothetical protein